MSGCVKHAETRGSGGINTRPSGKVSPLSYCNYTICVMYWNVTVNMDEKAS